MLLLTAVTFGGAEAEGALDHLPPAEAELLKHRAGALLQIPRERRIPLLVQEIKRLVTHRRAQLWLADPARLAALLKEERPALIEVVLRALPAKLASEVRHHLPPVQVHLVRDVRPEVLSIVRWKLDEVLTREAQQFGVFRFSDVLILQSRELLTICDRMGARALATCLAGLPEATLNAYVEALPPDQKAIATRAAAAGASRKLAEEDALALFEIHGGLENPSGALRSAGAHRFARACLTQSPEFALRMLERHPGELGKLLGRWLKEEKDRPARGDGGRADIVEQMERLAQKGVIDRPMRLPPPPKRPLAAATPPPTDVRPGKLPPAAAPGGGPRRDPIAEREARKAGAVSSRLSPPRGEPSVSNSESSELLPSEPDHLRKLQEKRGRAIPAARPAPEAKPRVASREILIPRRVPAPVDPSEVTPSESFGGEPLDERRLGPGERDEPTGPSGPPASPRRKLEEKRGRAVPMAPREDDEPMKVAPLQPLPVRKHKRPSDHSRIARTKGTPPPPRPPPDDDD